MRVVTAKNRNRVSGKTLNGVRVISTGYNSLKNVFYHLKKDAVKRGEARQEGKSGSGFLQKFNDIFIRNFYFPDDAFMWYLPAKKAAEKLLSAQKYDLVVSSALPFTAHLVMLSLRKKYPQPTWIADTGDPFAFQPLHPMNNYFLYGKLNRHLEKKVAEAADFVTLTNEGARKLYAEKFPEQEQKFRVIPPLLRTSARQPVLPEPRSRKDVIMLGYFGSFFRGIREPKPMLAFFAAFLQEYPELKDKIELHFYGNIFENFLPDFTAYPNLKSHIFMHGMIASERVQTEMQRMDFLLNAGNATDFQLPSKSVDYLVSGRPVINFCSIERDTFAEFLKGKLPILNISVGSIEYKKVKLFLEKKRDKEREGGERSKSDNYSTQTIARSYLRLSE